MSIYLKICILSKYVELSGHFVYHLLLALTSIGIEVFGFFIGSVVSLFCLRFGESCRLQFLYVGYFKRSHTFALRLESLDCDKLFGIDFEWRTYAEEQP